MAYMKPELNQIGAAELLVLGQDGVGGDVLPDTTFIPDQEQALGPEFE
jgi:hypothetical protein